MENNKLEELNNQVLDIDIQERIDQELSIIKDQDNVIKRALSKKQAAKLSLQQWQNYKPDTNLNQSKIYSSPKSEAIPLLSNTQTPKIERRGLNTPEFIYDNVLRLLREEDFIGEGLTVPDLEKFLRKDSITISREGIRASLKKMIENEVAKITNPNQQRNIRYAVIKNNVDSLM